jgi:hypothetical protein
MRRDERSGETSETRIRSHRTDVGDRRLDNSELKTERLRITYNK